MTSWSPKVHNLLMRISGLSRCCCNTNSKWTYWSCSNYTEKLEMKETVCNFWTLNDLSMKLWRVTFRKCGFLPQYMEEEHLLERNVPKDLRELVFTLAAVSHGCSHIMKKTSVLIHLVAKLNEKFCLTKGMSLRTVVSKSNPCCML